MTPRERATAALQGHIPDRVPCVPLIDTSYAAGVTGIPVSECFINPETYAAALVATLDRHPDIDGVSINTSQLVAATSDTVYQLTRGALALGKARRTLHPQQQLLPRARHPTRQC